jgi:hypothetical protein
MNKQRPEELVLQHKPTSEAVGPQKPKHAQSTLSQGIRYQAWSRRSARVPLSAWISHR